MNLQQLNFDYSLKNIPIASEQQYLKCLAEKMGSLMRRMLWKAFRYDQGLSSDDNFTKGNFGFKSMNSPPKNDYLKPFEEASFKKQRSR